MTQTVDPRDLHTGTTIALQGITKTYPGQTRPAVQALDLDVPTGAIVALVGPSGCGKTTTLKMMNRLIEPTAGRILLDGEDVTGVDADALRRRIGYVIQQVGLFPHFTIGENIAVVPRLVGWDRRRVTARVDELLALVGLEPREYRDRYPSQLSGGQQQRVGVARGLAADPAVVLMDEPFGAIDPITRERLQNELLEIQRQIAKTICIVTHDLGEAVTLGDRIAVFAPGGVIAQYDTPERVLTAPADGFVAEFVGAGAAVRRLSLLALGRLDLEPVTAEGGAGLRYRADDGGRITAWAAAGDDAPPLVTVPRSGTVYDAVDAMLDARAPLVAVVDDDGRPHGALRWEALVRELPDGGPAVTVTDRSAAAPAVPGRSTAPPRRRLPPSLVVTPVLVAVGLGAVALWAGARGLDDIEARTVNPGAIGQALGEHLLLTGVSTLVVIALAVPLGIALSRPGARRVRPAVLALGGFLQALPAFGVIVLLAFTPLGLSASSAIVALVVASFLPVLTNTVVGLAQVDRALVEAARGMGMSARQTLRRVELPLAVPVLVAGVRVALVLNVGSATLASYIGAGGLGVIIDTNLRLGRPTATVVAAAIVAALALLVDWLAGVAEHLVRRSA